MSLYADRVKETSTTTGTGTFSLDGAPIRFRTFVAGIGNGKQACYTIEHETADEWEVGIGTVTDGSPDTLSRTTILASSNAGAAVDFSAGNKTVFCTLPANHVLYYPERFPLAPTTYDDEFVNPTLDSKWSVELDATATGFVKTPNKYGSFLCLEGPGAASNQNWELVQNIGAAGNAGVQCSITGRIAFSELNSGAGSVYFGWQQDVSTSTGDRHWWRTVQSGNDTMAQLYIDGSLNVGQGIGANQTSLWVHFQRSSGNVLSAWYSTDGLQWKRRYSTSRSNNLPYIRLMLRGNGASNPFQALVDFVRVNWLYLPVA